MAIAPVAGPVWPMKNWAHYDALQRRLEAQGLRVNVLPKRATLLEHLGDAYAALSRFPEALAAYRQSSELHSPSASLREKIESTQRRGH